MVEVMCTRVCTKRLASLEELHSANIDLAHEWVSISAEFIRLRIRTFLFRCLTPPFRARLYTDASYFWFRHSSDYFSSLISPFFLVNPSSYFISYFVQHSLQFIPSFIFINWVVKNSLRFIPSFVSFYYFAKNLF